MLMVLCAILTAGPSGAQQRRPTPPAAAKPKPAPPAALKVEPAAVKCAELLGTGVKTHATFCFVLAGRDPAQGVQDGVYILTALVVDDAGATASTTMTVVVGNGAPSGPGAPYPSIPAVPKVPIRLSFTPSPDQDSGVTSYAIAVHRDGDALSDRPVASASLGMPAVTDGTITVNIDATMDLTPGGTYYIVVRAIGPGGESTDAVSGLFSK